MDRGDGPAAVPSCFFACEDPRSTRAFDAVFFRSVVHDADAGHLGRVVLRDAGESAGDLHRHLAVHQGLLAVGLGGDRGQAAVGLFADLGRKRKLAEMLRL